VLGGVDPGELAFEGGEERLDCGVVVAVAGGAEGLVDLELDDALGERQGCVGGAAVGVVHDSSIWPPALEGHDEGVADQFGVRGGAHGPANDPSGPQIDDRGQVQPALTGAELGHVRSPQPVGARRVEIALDQVRSRSGVGSAPSPAAAGMHADQLLGAHQASDPLAATAPPEPSQLGMHPGGAVGAPRPVVNLDDHPRELGVAHRPRRGRAAEPGVEPRS
jgi:hypothetical protein